MRIIISGGSGLIGRALTASLTADGHEVIILSRTPQQVKGLPGGAKAVGWDGRTAAGWGDLVDGSKAIVNLAGEGIAAGRWTAARKQRLRDSRVNPGRAVVEAVGAADNKPNLVIQASAVGYYGPGGDQRINERTPPGNDFLAGICTDWEAATAPIGNMGIRLISIRSGLVLSSAGGALPKMALPFKFFLGGPVGHGRQWFSWIHIDDEIAAIRYLIDKETAPGPYNLTAPTPLTNAEFGRILGQVLGRPAFMPVPALAMKLIFGELSTTLLDGQRVMPYALQEAGYRFKFPNVESALRNIFS